MTYRNYTINLKEVLGMAKNEVLADIVDSDEDYIEVQTVESK